MAARVSLTKEELEFLLGVCKDQQKLHRKFRKALALTAWEEEEIVLKNESPIKPVSSVLVSKEQAYIKWSSDPTTCTENEVQLATDYRYNNNMMTDQERKNYETYLNCFGDI